MHIEPLGLVSSEAVGDRLEFLPDRVQVIQALLQTEVGQVVGADFVAQEGEELFVLFEEGVFKIGAENMVAMLDLVDHGGQLAR